MPSRLKWTDSSALKGKIKLEEGIKAGCERSTDL